MLPRAVIVTRPTDYERLLERHATHGQASFFLETRGQSIDEVEARHRCFEGSLQQVTRAIPRPWSRTRVRRRDLDRFLFEPRDIVIAVGQDGLVANVAKYLRGQRVIGINPEPDRFDGILAPHAPGSAAELLARVQSPSCPIESRTMVAAEMDDGQTLLALNEIFIGHQTHQSARYRIVWGQARERHSSSGLIVSTGTGATGWTRSIHRQRRTSIDLPTPCESCLAFFVREAFPSVATGTDLCEGLIREGAHLTVISEMNEGGVLFGDGIEEDRITFNWGMKVRLQIAEVKLQLVH